MRTNNILSSSQLIKQNPILAESSAHQKEYFSMLKHFIRSSKLSSRKNIKAQLLIYDNVLNCSDNKKDPKGSLDKKYFCLLPFDLIFISGYDVSSDKITTALKSIIKSCGLEKPLFSQLVSYCSGNYKMWKKIETSQAYSLFPEYLSLFRSNYEFSRRRKYTILITATMSAGKSTLINALCGKNVTLSQNMACTSQLHYIYSKQFEDGYIYEYDHALTFDAGPDELLNDDPYNKSGKIAVSTFFNGDLSGKPIVFNDTPGVNSNINDKHKTVTNKIIRSKRYDLVIYVLNATQLGTIDDEEHLMFVKNSIGNKPIIFLLNKIDEFNIEDDDPMEIIEEHKGYLSRIGFKDPVVCPVSAKYAFLSKKAAFGELSRLERRELDIAMLNFDEMDYSSYYNNNFKDIGDESSKNDSDGFLKKCGMEFFEKILCSYIDKKENKNG